PAGAGRAPTGPDAQTAAATTRALEAAARTSRFREDLFFRLNVVRIVVPPLRERRADIAELIEFFIDKVNRDLGTTIVGVTDEVRDTRMRHHWPGNVRELENTLLRAAVLPPRR